MINLQNPNIPPPSNPIEIDKAVYNLQLKLDTKLNWLSNSYGRAYRHVEKNQLKLYFPEVYIGGSKREYFRVTPDNDKSGMCFFVVGKEEDYDFEVNHKNYLKWNVGIVFNVNLDLINKPLLDNEIFTQQLIRDVRDVLTMHIGGIGFGLKIKEVVTELREIYKEFNLKEEEEYLRAPMQGFRFNCEITLQEDCSGVTYNPCEAVKKNLSPQEKNCVLGSLDFSDSTVFNSLSQQQQDDLNNSLNPNINSSGTRIPNTIPINGNGTQTAWLNKSNNASTSIGSITKNIGSGNNFDCGGIFVISTLGNFKVEFNIENGDYIAGIGYTDSGYNLEDVEFGFRISGGVAVECQENGNIVSGITAITTVNKLKIEKNGFQIRYYIDSTLIHTSYLLQSQNQAQGFMIFDCSIATEGKKIENLLLTYL